LASHSLLRSYRRACDRYDMAAARKYIQNVADMAAADRVFDDAAGNNTRDLLYLSAPVL
jgi:hypothetical protein